VTLNRYQNETPLNNTSYEFNAGWDWQTIESLSGSVNATLQERLAYPTSNGVTPTQTRNMETHKGFDGVARWGGASLLTLEGRAGLSWVDYSAPEYQPSESRADVESLGLYYRPSGFWRFGIAGRLQRTDSPQAVLLPDGSRTGNVARSRNVDFLADYDGGNTLSGSGRISYTWQTNSGFNNSDFSGFTGSLDLRYRPTGKLAFTFSIARETGLDTGASLYNVGSVPGTSSLYQNNQVTASAVLGASYAATAKINVGAYGHYSRSKLLASAATGVDPNTIYDENRGVSLSANYAYSRALSFACALTRDRRIVTGPPSYAYDASTGSCSGQFLWR
jgi:hypothetical protein